MRVLQKSNTRIYFSVDFRKALWYNANVSKTTIYLHK